MHGKVLNSLLVAPGELVHGKIGPADAYADKRRTNAFLHREDLFEERFPDKPWVIVNAKVCRPGWLIEMETMAVKKQEKPFPAF